MVGTTTRAVEDHRFGRAFGATALIFNSVLWALICAVALRTPHHGLVWALPPMLCTAGSLANPTRRERVTSVALNLLQVALFQWVLSSLTPYVVSRVIAVTVMIGLTSLRRNAANSGVVMAGVIAGWNHETFIAGLDNMLALLLITVCIVPTYWFWDFALLRGWGGLPPVPRRSGTGLCRRAAAFSTAIVIYNSVDWVFGSWIPLTLALSYNNGAVGQNAQAVALRRLAVAPLGLLLGVLYLSTFGYLGVMFSYAVVLWGVIGYFFNYFFGKFTYFYIPFLMMLCCADNLVYGRNPLFGNGWNFFFQSLISVGIGAFLVFVFELPRATGERSSGE